jgi:plasmid stabilization system protein ParE
MGQEEIFLERKFVICYVALFEIEDGETVTILAIRHQREDDYI